MAGANFVLDKGYLAEGAITRFHCVKFGTAAESVIMASGTNDLCIGICQETITTQDVTDGRITDIRVMGISRAIAQAAITKGVRVRAHSSGKVTTVSGAAGTVDNIVGIAMETVTTDGDHLNVLLTPGVTVNTAAS